MRALRVLVAGVVVVGLAAGLVAAGGWGGGDAAGPGSGSEEAVVFWGGTLLANLFGVAPSSLLFLPLVVGTVLVASFLAVGVVLAGIGAVVRRHRAPAAPVHTR